MLAAMVSGIIGLQGWLVSLITLTTGLPLSWWMNYRSLFRAAQVGGGGRCVYCCCGRERFVFWVCLGGGEGCAGGYVRGRQVGPLLKALLTLPAVLTGAAAGFEGRFGGIRRGWVT